MASWARGSYQLQEAKAKGALKITKNWLNIEKWGSLFVLFVADHQMGPFFWGGIKLYANVVSKVSGTFILKIMLVLQYKM